MEYYRLPLYIIFGVLPSLIWLFYYLGKDLHPEPKKMILKVFLYGTVATIPVFLVQIGLSELLNKLQYLGFFVASPILVDILKWFLVIALTEEIFKYLVIKLIVFKSYELDEPVDIMIYMVVSALGFAALENILYMFAPVGNSSFDAVFTTTITISFIRFVGATFIHTLCSALLGYFLTMSCLDSKKKLKLTITGISAAAFFHGLYNFSIIKFNSPMNFIVPTIIIFGLAVFVIRAFDKTKKLKGKCKI